MQLLPARAAGRLNGDALVNGGEVAGEAVGVGVVRQFPSTRACSSLARKAVSPALRRVASSLRTPSAPGAWASPPCTVRQPGGQPGRVVPSAAPCRRCSTTARAVG
ncbi:hypothetical protein ACFQX6_55800 [Streptosporangium lutulentum]